MLSLKLILVSSAAVCGFTYSAKLALLHVIVIPGISLKNGSVGNPLGFYAAVDIWLVPALKLSDFQLESRRYSITGSSALLGCSACRSTFPGSALLLTRADKGPL